MDVFKYQFSHHTCLLICLSLTLLTTISLSGCPKTNTPSSGTDSAQKLPEDKQKSSAKQPPTKEIVAGWSTPKVALILSGEIHGYLEPCGCSEKQSGGMSRRGDLFTKLMAKGWPVVGLDLGGTLKNSRRQSQIKFRIIHAAMSGLGYDAMTLGPEELALGADNLFTLGDSAARNPGQTQLVSANVVFFGTRDVGVPVQMKIVEENDVKIGVIGILGDSYKKEIIPAGADESLLSIEAMTPALEEAIAKMDQEAPSVKILLSHARPDETRALLTKFPIFDAAMTAGGIEDPYKDPELIGKTLLIEVGQKGKKVGVLGYYPDQDVKFRYELVELDSERFGKTRLMEEQMRYYQEILKDEKLVESEPAVPHPSGTTYVGSESCGECHTKAYAKWKTTKHGSRSFEDLINNNRNGFPGDPPISRIYDPECLCCHATGWEPQEVFRYEGGYLNLSETPHLTAQGCENCHGPGKRHDDLERAFKNGAEKSDELLAARQEVKRSRATAETQMCIQCHDNENSPKFNYEKYWEEVWHPWKD